MDKMTYFKNMRVPFHLAKFEDWDDVINDLIPPDSFKPINI